MLVEFEFLNFQIGQDLVEEDLKNRTALLEGILLTGKSQLEVVMKQI